MLLSQRSLLNVSLARQVLASAMALFFVIIFCQTVSAQGELTEKDARLQALAVSSDGSDVFILNDNSTVTVYNTKRKEFTANSEPISIPLLGTRMPENILLSTQDRFFMVSGTNGTLHHFAVYDSASFLVNDGLFKKTVGLSVVSQEIGSSIFSAFSGDEKKIYFVDSKIHTLHTFNIETLKLASTPLNIEGRVSAFVPETKGNLGFLLTFDPGYLFVVDLGSGEVVARYEVGTFPVSMEYDQVLNKVYVVDRNSDSVAEVDIDTKQVQFVKTGPIPVDIEHSKKTGHVFVASNGDGTILDIAPDGSKKSIKLNVVGVAGYPISLWYSNETERLVAVNTFSQDVFVIDTASGSIVYTEKVGGFPTSVIGGSGGSVAVIRRQNASDIVLVDTVTQALSTVSAIPSEEKDEKIFSAPNSVRYHTQSNRLFVANQGTGDITVVDGTTLKFIKKIPLGFQPGNTFLSGDKLYIANPAGDSLAVVDVSDGSYITEQVATNGTILGLNGFGGLQKIYITFPTKGSVGVVDMTTNKLTSEIFLGEGGLFPYTLARSDQRNELYVGNYGADSVSIIDATKDALVKTITVGKKPFWVRYHMATGRVLATSEGAKELVVIDPELLTVSQRIKLGGVPHRIIIDEATGLVYVNHRGGDMDVEIYKADEGGTFSLLETRKMSFIGELSSRYNQYACDTCDMANFNENTKRAYFTSSKADRVVVASVLRDEKGILTLIQAAAVFESGDSWVSSARSKLKGLSRTGTVVALGMIVVAALLIFRRMKKHSVVLPPTSASGS